MKIFFLLSTIFFFFISFGCKEEQSTEPTSIPTTKIISPNDQIEIFDTVKVIVEAQDPKGIAEVVLYVNNDSVATDLFEPFEFVLTRNNLETGANKLYAKAIDADRNFTTSPIITIFFYDLLMPTFIRASNKDSSSIYLAWFDNSLSEDGFVIYQSINDGEWQELKRTEKNIEFYLVDNLNIENNYKYKILAFKGDIYSNFDRIININYRYALNNEESFSTSASYNKYHSLEYDEENNKIIVTLEKGWQIINAVNNNIEVSKENYFNTRITVSKYIFPDISIFGTDKGELIINDLINSSPSLPSNKIYRVLKNKIVAVDCNNTYNEILLATTDSIFVYELFPNIFDTDSINMTAKQSVFNSDIREAKYSPNINRVLVAGENGELIEYDLISKSITKNFIGHSGIVFSFAFNENKNILISGSGDKSIKIWDFSTNNLIESLESSYYSVISVDYNDKFIVAGENKGLEVWENNQKVYSRMLHSDYVLDVLIRNQKIYSISNDNLKIGSFKKEWVWVN